MKQFVKTIIHMNAHAKTSTNNKTQANIQKLTLDQKKFLVLDAILLEQISNDAENHL